MIRPLGQLNCAIRDTSKIPFGGSDPAPLDSVRDDANHSAFGKCLAARLRNLYNVFVVLAQNGAREGTKS